ncbi:ribosome maturation factor RimM [Chloroflexota bacterium]
MDSLTPQFIPIGEVLTPHGTKGHFLVEPLTDFPERFDAGSKIYINRQPLTIDTSSVKKSNFIIKVNAVDSAEDANKLQGQQIEIYNSQLKSLAKGQYYHFQLIGLCVYTVEGEPLGSIKQILSYPGNDVYVVEGEEDEILIPAVEDVVKRIDIKRRRMIVEAIDGLLELNKKKE